MWDFVGWISWKGSSRLDFSAGLISGFESGACCEDTKEVLWCLCLVEF